MDVQGLDPNAQYISVDGLNIDDATLEQGATQFVLADGEYLEGVSGSIADGQVAYLDGGYTMAIPVQGADGETVYLQGVDLDQVVGNDGQEMVLISAEEAEALSAAGAAGLDTLTNQQWSSAFGDQVSVFFIYIRKCFFALVV